MDDKVKKKIALKPKKPIASKINISVIDNNTNTSYRDPNLHLTNNNSYISNTNDNDIAINNFTSNHNLEVFHSNTFNSNFSNNNNITNNSVSNNISFHTNNTIKSNTDGEDGMNDNEINNYNKKVVFKLNEIENISKTDTNIYSTNVFNSNNNLFYTNTNTNDYMNNENILNRSISKLKNKNKCKSNLKLFDNKQKLLLKQITVKNRILENKIIELEDVLSLIRSCNKRKEIKKDNTNDYLIRNKSLNSMLKISIENNFCFNSMKSQSKEDNMYIDNLKGLSIEGVISNMNKYNVDACCKCGKKSSNEKTNSNEVNKNIMLSKPTIPTIPIVSNIPSIPKIPNILGVTSIPSIPNIPNIPNIPGVSSIPNIPKIPGMQLIPNIIGVSSSIPNIPGIPSIPNIPGIPSIPKIPGIPGVPSIPTVSINLNIKPKVTFLTLPTESSNYNPKEYNRQKISIKKLPDNKLKTTFWPEIITLKLPSIFSAEVIDKLFAKIKEVKVVNKDIEKRDSSSSITQAPKLVSLLDGKRSQNLNIIISGFKFTLNDLFNTLNNFDTEGLE